MIDISHLVNLCRSPVEKMLMSGFLSDAAIDASLASWGECDFEVTSDSLRILRGGEDITVVPQHQICRITVDFLVQMVGCRQSLVIEVDGHDWHERTKAQAQADKSRDRMLIRMGFIPIRFTGSEVWANAGLCALEAIETIEEIGGREMYERQHGFSLGRTPSEEQYPQ